MDEVVITKENFNEYFFDIRKHKPKPGQIIACYTAMADFIDSFEKRSMIELLRTNTKPIAAAQIMRKIMLAADPDCYKILIEIINDLLGGMSVDEVAEKPHKFKLEVYYYTNKEYIPSDDPHWSTISIVDMNKVRHIELSEK